MSAGPIVNEISASFDMFWNSEWALPIAAVVEDRATEQDLQDLRKRLAEKLAPTGYPYPIDEQLAGLRERLIQIRDNFIWAAAPFTSRSTRTIIWCGPMSITSQKWSTTQIRKRVSCTGF